MKRKKLGALAVCLGLMAGLLSIPASAAKVEDGVYTASMVTSYYNPDTGNVDDRGTANAALGEGMCRSATDKTCLVEVDGEDIWITVRLLLQSNCSNVALYAREDYDSYTQVSYDIMAEDAANDSIDYRIKVSEVGQKLKCTMYVTPMGRDVLWYLSVDPSTLTADSGDFVVSIDPSGEPEKPAEGQETPVPTSTPAPTPTPAPSVTPSQPPKEAEEPSPTPKESEEPTQPLAESPKPEEVEPSEAPEESKTAPEHTQVPEEHPEEAGIEEVSITSLPVGGIVILALILLGAGTYLIKRKR